MIINGNEYGFTYDQGAIIELCETLGLEYVDELQEAYLKAFKPLTESKKVSTAFLKISHALIIVCANRWSDRNNKSYRLTLNEVYDLDSDQIGMALKSVYEIILKGQSKKREEGEGEVKKK